MSGRKIGSNEDFQPVTVQSKTTRLDLPAGAIKIFKNGIEFRSQAPFSVWSEMTVCLQSPLEPKTFNCNGVVIACHGNRHAGYQVSMAFTNLTRQAQARLSTLAFSS